MSAVTDVVRVAIPERSVRHDVRAVKIVLHRELIRFWRDKMRMLSGLMQPILWLLVMGNGLSNLTRTPGATAPGVDLKTFIFPGVCAMSAHVKSLSQRGMIEAHIIGPRDLPGWET